jgi:hypothetical protein
MERGERAASLRVDTQRQHPEELFGNEARTACHALNPANGGAVVAE